MSDELTPQELREKARVDYGIANADAMNDEQLKAEMEAIDSQAKSVDAEQAETKVDENTDENEVKPLDKQKKGELLETAKAEGVEIDETDTVPVLREKIQAARDEREAGNEDEDEDEDKE